MGGRPNLKTQVQPQDTIIIKYKNNSNKIVTKVAVVLSVTDTGLYLDLSPKCKYCKTQVDYDRIIKIEKE